MMTNSQIKIEQYATIEAKPHGPQTLLFKALHHAIEWPLINAALQVRLFDSLTIAATAQTVAQQQQWDKLKTEHYLDALTSLGLLCKQKTSGQDASYQLEKAYAPLLDSRHGDSMHSTLMHLSKIKISNPHELLKELSSSTANRPREQFNSNQFWQRASDNLRSFHRSVSRDYCVNLIQSLPQWPATNRMLDLGAGSETLAIALTKNKPNLSYHLFDLPEVIAQITSKIPSDLSAITLHSGNYNTTALPKGFDIIYASMSLYYAENLDQLLTNIQTNLLPNGVFISLHEGLTQQRTQPSHHVIGRLLPALKGNDFSFDQGEIATRMLAAGFKQVHSQSLDTPFGPMDLDIGYK